MELFQTSFADEGLAQKGVRAIFPLTTGRNQKKREQWSIGQSKLTQAWLQNTVIKLGGQN